MKVNNIAILLTVGFFLIVALMIIQDRIHITDSNMQSSTFSAEQINEIKMKLREEIRSGHLGAVDKILKSVSLDQTQDQILLFDAVVADHFSGQLVERLLLLGLNDVNQRDKIGQTMLHVAAFRGHHEAAELLIKSGADVNAVDIDSESKPSFRETPLHIAARHGTWRVAKILLQNGADANARTRSGLTALDIALQQADKDHESAWGKNKVANLIHECSQSDSSE
jgi:ankyrin repeat protein